MNINEIINQKNFDESERMIIYKLNEQIEKGNSKITVRELSKLTFCSSSKIIRLAKKIGFYGYSDMLFSFRKKHEKIVTLKFNESFEIISITDESIKVIDRLIQDITSNEYQVIYLEGLGYSSFVCDYFRDKLIELGIFATCMNPEDILIHKGKYLLILVSNSGETEDIIKIAKESGKYDCKMYVMSSQIDSKLCKLVQNNIIIITQKGDNQIYQKVSYFTGNAIVLVEKIIEIIKNFYKIGGQ